MGDLHDLALDAAVGLDGAEVSNASYEPCSACGTFHVDDVCHGWSKRAWKYVGTYYREYADPLRQYVHRVAGYRGLSESLVDAEGVVHEAFLAMAIGNGHIENPRAWLFAVAHRLVGKIAAQHQHRRAVGDPHTVLDTGRARWSTLAIRLFDPADLYEAHEVVKAMRKLPDRQKVAVYLRHVAGWSTAEISDYLHCAPATASVHIHRGTARLREILLGALGGLVILVASVAIAFSRSTTQLVRPGGPPPMWAPPPVPAPEIPGLSGWTHLAQVMGIGMLIVVGFFMGVLCVLTAANISRHALRKRRCGDRSPDPSGDSATASHHAERTAAVADLFPWVVPPSTRDEALLSSAGQPIACVEQPDPALRQDLHPPLSAGT